MTNGDEQMLSRIGFAERWLTRARGQWTAGNHERSLLTLVLADAELRHAMDAAGARRRTKARHPTVATGFLLAAVVASALLLIGRWPSTPQVAAITSPPPLVKPSVLPSGPVDAVMRPTQSAIVVPVSTVAPGEPARTASSQMAAPPPAQGQANSASTSGLAASLRFSSRSRPSLLDLVLTAERVLRQDPAGSSLP
jgi:hypothetical protein